jgi:hypothetical protein
MAVSLHMVTHIGFFFNSNLLSCGAINIWYIGLPHFSYNISIFALQIIDPLYNCLGVKVGSIFSLSPQNYLH